MDGVWENSIPHNSSIHRYVYTYISCHSTDVHKSNYIYNNFDIPRHSRTVAFIHLNDYVVGLSKVNAVETVFIPLILR